MGSWEKDKETQDDVKHECHALAGGVKTSHAHQHQPNQVEGVNGAGAGLQQQQRVPADNANFFIEVLQSMQHSQQQIMEEIC